MNNIHHKYDSATQVPLILDAFKSSYLSEDSIWIWRRGKCGTSPKLLNLPQPESGYCLNSTFFWCVFNADHTGLIYFCCAIKGTENSEMGRFCLINAVQTTGPGCSPLGAEEICSLAQCCSVFTSQSDNLTWERL